MLQRRLNKVLTEEFKDKEFVYVTEYGGEVFGKVHNVSVTSIFGMDRESSRKFQLGKLKLNRKAEEKEKETSPVEGFVKWRGEKFYIEVGTKNGNYYKLDKVFFLI